MAVELMIEGWFTLSGGRYGMPGLRPGPTPGRKMPFVSLPEEKESVSTKLD